MSKPIKREFPSRQIPNWIDEGSKRNFQDIRYETAEGIAKITINRPEVRNAFRPQTIIELKEAFDIARDDEKIGVVIFTGAGDEAFCSGGDINVRGDDGYIGDDSVGSKGIGRLNVLDLQIQIRRMPKPVIAMVAGWAIGGGHVLHVVCDLTIAAGWRIWCRFTSKTCRSEKSSRDLVPNASIRCQRSFRYGSCKYSCAT
ncbi:MAG: hypothetical protein RLZ80_835 [Actinomycetota bacterium]